MARYSTTIQSRLSVEEAWARVADVTTFADWDPGVIEAVQVSGDGPGPNAAYELTVKGIRGDLDLRYDVNQYDPPHQLFLVADTGVLRSEDEITVEPDAEGCRLTYRADLRFGGFYSIANPFLAVAFKVIGWRAARGLRSYLEAPRRVG